VLRYNVKIPKLPRGVSLEEYKQKRITPIQLRVINVLKTWLDMAFLDFDRKLLSRVEDFAANQLANEAEHEALSKQIRSVIQKRSSSRESRMFKTAPETGAAATNAGEASGSKADISATHIVSNFDEEEIAKQLTVIDTATFHAIKPVEFLNQAWNKPDLKHRAINVLHMIQRFNQVSAWATLSILWQEKIADRIRTYEKLVNITEHLRKMNNFNSMLAILSGLNSSAVFRLKYTREELSPKSQKLFAEFMDLMSSKSSYKAYRDTLHQANPPVIPYMGTYLTDITFIEDGNKDNINNLINFRKRELVSNVILEIQMYQQVLHKFAPRPQLINLLNQLPHAVDSDKMYQLSLLREPRTAERSDIV